MAPTAGDFVPQSSSGGAPAVIDALPNGKEGVVPLLKLPIAPKITMPDGAGQKKKTVSQRHPTPPPLKRGPDLAGSGAAKENSAADMEEEDEEEPASSPEEEIFRLKAKIQRLELELEEADEAADDKGEALEQMAVLLKEQKQETENERVAAKKMMQVLMRKEQTNLLIYMVVTASCLLPPGANAEGAG